MRRADDKSDYEIFSTNAKVNSIQRVRKVNGTDYEMSSMEQRAIKNENNCLNTNIYS